MQGCSPPDHVTTTRLKRRSRHTPVRGKGSTASRTTMPAKAKQMATLAWDTRASRRGERTAMATGQAAHTVMPAWSASSE